MSSSKTVDTLNDLLQIANDRLKGFQEVDKKVISNYPGLSAEYDHMVIESTKMKTELSSLIEKNGGDAENSTTVAGGLHRTWIDVKNAFLVNKNESTLENVLFGENAAIKAYEDALESGDLDPASRAVVSDQLHDLHASYRKFQSFEKDSDLE
jgi:uncharacterized protein (TIGR02284 family)